MMPAINNKNVLFITTKNRDYIRNIQEIRLIKERAKACKIIASSNKHYFFRLLYIFISLFTTSVTEFDTIFIGFAPQLILPLFLWKFRNKYIIIDFFISLYDTLCCDRQRIQPESRLGGFLHYIDETTIAHADFVICDTITHGKYFTSEFCASPDKLYPLYLQADSFVFYPVSVKRPRHLQNKFVVLYFGSILPLQGADIVLQAMSQLKDKKDLFFYFIGPMKKKMTHAIFPDSDNIKYINWLPQTELTLYIAQSDLCLAGHFNGSIDKAKRTIPGKAYIYQAMRKPMILGDNPANHELFREDSNTVFVEMGNAKALAEAIAAFSMRQKPG